MSDPSPQVLDRIYTAAVDPAAWGAVMQDMQHMFRCLSAGLYSSDLKRKDVGLISLQDFDRDWVNLYVRQYMCTNPWTAVPEFQQVGAVRTEESLDVYYNDHGYYRRTPFYNEWMKPQEFIHSLGTNLTHDGPISTKLILYRPAGPGPFSETEIRQFRVVSGHLARAVGMARRLALRDSRAVHSMGLIDSLRYGILFLDDGLRVMQANRFAEELFHRRDGLEIEAGQLRASHRDDRQGLETVLNSALAVHLGLSSAVPQTGSTRRETGESPLRISAIPLPRQGRDPFLVRHAAVVVMIVDPELEFALPAQWLQHRYGLTTGESRLVQGLLGGSTLRDAATDTGLTYETARSYLKIVFQKTGTARQSQLISTLLHERACSRLDS